MKSTLNSAASSPAPPAGVRLDKWLWAARFYKTRGAASDDIGRGRVSVNGVVAKASRELRPGDVLQWRQDAVQRTVTVKALSNQRGPAPVAQALYEETPDSIRARQAAAVARRQGVEPATSLAQGRPTKRNRRELVEWQRWSASIDDPTGR